jgi:hypothetical protein
MPGLRIKPKGDSRMANYVLVYRGGERTTPPSEEEGKAITAAWIKWFEGLGAALVDNGNPFGPSMSVAPDGTTSEGTASRLTGYSIVKADSLGDATEMAKGCPQLATDGGTVEVYETFQVM